MNILLAVLSVVAVLLALSAVYFAGVYIRLHREGTKPTIGAFIDSLFGLIESLGANGLIFGLVFGAASETPPDQLVGIVFSALLLSFRGGYSFREAFLRLAKLP